MKISKVIPLYQLETIYRILLQRIAKGYSARQLSFLIGAAAGYVEEVESLLRPFYSGAELARIAQALDDTDVDTFFPAINDDSEIRITIDKLRYKEKWIHTYCRIDEQNEEEELFRLREDLDMDFDDLPDGDEVLALVEDIIDVLVRSGYFYEPKLPLEVFKAVNNLLPSAVSPFYISAAMMRFCDEESDSGRLRLTGHNGAAYRYEEC
jgi:transcriptional regulator with XRE-family HTH domain